MEENEKIRQARLEYLRHTQLERQDTIDTPKNIIQKAVERKFPGIDKMEAEKITRQMVLAPKKATIIIGGEERKVSALQYDIACTIESLGSETSSSQEYFGWFTESADIIKNMNDGFVSEDDLESRNEWIEDSYGREAELMTCLALFQGCAFPEAKKKANDIYNKLVKLRQIRSSIKESTSNKVDKPKEVDMEKKKEAYKKAVVYVAAAREFCKHAERWNMKKRTLKKLNVYHGDDEDLDDDYDDFYDMYEDDLRLNDEQEIINQEEYPDNPIDLSYSFIDNLKEDILFHWDDDKVSSQGRSEAEAFIERVNEGQELETKEDIVDHIARLSGRRPPVKNRPLGYDMDRARAFSGAHFRSLDSGNSL